MGSATTHAPLRARRRNDSTQQDRDQRFRRRQKPRVAEDSLVDQLRKQTEPRTTQAVARDAGLAPLPLCGGVRPIYGVTRMTRMDWEGARRRDLPAGPRAMPRREPRPTDKQRSLVKRLGGSLPRRATRADAATLIDRLLAERRAARRRVPVAVSSQEAWYRDMESRRGGGAR
jgi:hypothetical protein